MFDYFTGMWRYLIFGPASRRCDDTEWFRIDEIANDGTITRAVHRDGTPITGQISEVQIPGLGPSIVMSIQKPVAPKRYFWGIITKSEQSGNDVVMQVAGKHKRTEFVQDISKSAQDTGEELRIAEFDQDDGTWHGTHP